MTEVQLNKRVTFDDVAERSRYAEIAERDPMVKRVQQVDDLTLDIIAHTPVSLVKRAADDVNTLVHRAKLLPYQVPKSYDGQQQTMFGKYLEQMFTDNIQAFTPNKWVLIFTAVESLLKIIETRFFKDGKLEAPGFFQWFGVIKDLIKFIKQIFTING